jgi:hypothetical protein
MVSLVYQGRAGQMSLALSVARPARCVASNTGSRQAVLLRWEEFAAVAPEATLTSERAALLDGSRGDPASTSSDRP